MNDWPSPTPEQMAELLAFLPVFENPDYVPSEVDFSVSLIAPHVWDKHLTAFVEMFYRYGWVIPFDWPNWQESAEAYFIYPEKLSSAPAKDIWKLLTVHVRKDRFVDGHLPSMVNNGHIAACLHRLGALSTPG